MSSTKIPTHVVVIPNKVLVPMAWRKEYGPPTVDNLIDYGLLTCDDECDIPF